MLILASSSLSRKKLLESAEIDFIQKSSSFDESTINNNIITDLALELSLGKATNVLQRFLKNPIKKFRKSSLEILGCDSIFEFEGNAYGKPSNKKEAYERWQRMSNNYGYLHTGHTLIFCAYSKNKENIEVIKLVKKVVSSKIYFSKLEDQEIINYVDTLEPLYCAGGFALEGKGGKYIEKIEGCFSNVMGLSLPWLRKMLL